MDENFGKLGIQDFFNVVFVGGIFGICASWVCPILWNIYTGIGENYKYERYVGTILILFGIGIVMQELSSIWDDKVGKIKENVLSKFLTDSTVIGNEVKWKIYRKLGKDVLREKGKAFHKDFTNEQCKFIYAYCLYYIENRGKSGKYEKMRGLFDMAKTLKFCCAILAGLSMINLLRILYVNEIIYSREISVSILQVLIFLISSKIFDNRAKRCMRYKTRMLMEVFDVCKDLEKTS